MTRTLSKFPAVGLVLTMVLAACGGSIGASNTPAASASGTAAAFPTGSITLELWTKEGDPNIQYVIKLTQGYTDLHPNIKFKVVNKDVEVLREDMVNTALAPQSQPQLLWTVADHIGPFTAADVIQELTGKINEATYAPSAMAGAKVGDKVWAEPISNGNQLMLYYNKSLVPNPPTDTDQMIQIAQQNTGAGKYGLVYNQTESFWLAPWLGGFGGSVFKADGKSPNLNTPEMKAAFSFLWDLTYKYKVMPKGSDYQTASDLFTKGKAAMIVNGDWELGNYKNLLGDKLGVMPLPKVTSTGKSPAPYTAGAYWMLPKNDSGDVLTVALDFLNWSTNKENQLKMVDQLQRLPANAVALADPKVTGDPLLKGAADAVALGTPQPTNVEMRCVFDAEKNVGMADIILKGSNAFDDELTKMQTAAVNCVAKL